MEEVKLSASLILAKPQPDGSYSMLLMKRKKGMVYSEAHVFPGGGWEPGDATNAWASTKEFQPQIIPKTPHIPEIELTSLKLTAIRETFEEAGVFIGSGALGPPVTGNFQRLCLEKGAVPDPGQLHYFCRIISPAGEKVRFDTVFFICRVPPDTDFQINEESESAEWMSPLTALNLAENRKIKLLPPQVYVIWLLAHHLLFTELEGAIRCIQMVPLIPVGQKNPKDKGFINLLPGDEFYPYHTALKSSSGSRHRGYVGGKHGLKNEVSPGLIPFVDCSKWRLTSENGQYVLHPKSRL